MNDAVRSAIDFEGFGLIAFETRPRPAAASESFSRRREIALATTVWTWVSVVVDTLHRINEN